MKKECEKYVRIPGWFTIASMICLTYLMGSCIMLLRQAACSSRQLSVEVAEVITQAVYAAVGDMTKH